MAEKVTITCLTEAYRGTDPATGARVELDQGDTAEVSAEKAEQLQRDFPDWFEVAAAKPPARKPAAKPKPKTGPQR